MSEWASGHLGDYANLLVGFAFKSTQFSFDPAGPRLVRGDNIKRGVLEWGHSTRYWPEPSNELLSRYSLRSGDVVVGMDGSRVGENFATIADTDLPALLVQRVACIRAGNQLDQQFLKYLICNPSFTSYVKSVHTGTSIPHVSGQQISDYPISLPPLPEQRAIAEVLGALDDKIEANRRRAGTVRRLTSAAFQAAMVDVVTDGIPLCDVVQFVFGEPFKSSDFNMEERGRPLIRIRDLKTFRPQFWTTESRPRETVVEPGDVVVGMDAEFRPTLWLGTSGLLNQRVCVATPKLGGRAFVRELLEEPLAQVESFKSGTTVSHLNKVDLESIKVSLPEPEAIVRFANLAEPLREVIVSLHRENRGLVAIRDALLPKLLSGELRVRDAEHLVEEAV